jgi:hypothetical protein
MRFEIRSVTGSAENINQSKLAKKTTSVLNGV